MTPFVETSVSRDVFRTIDLARKIGKCAAIVGRPGIGKTRAINVYAQANGCYLMTVTAVTGNALRDLMRDIGECLNIYTTGSIANMQRQMFNYDLTGHVLIIDEAQNLKLQAYRELLHLHDFTGLVLVFCGNEEVLKRVNTDKGAFAQISRRVPVRTDLNSLFDEDCDRLGAALGADGMDAFKLLRALGHAHHTDGIVSVMGVAADFVGDGKTIKAAEIRRACDVLSHYRSALR